MLVMPLLRDHVIFVVLDIYIFGYKVRTNSSQVTVCESTWKYCESITLYISIIANGKFLLRKCLFGKCLSVRNNLEQKNSWISFCNSAENFYSMCLLPPNSWFIFSKVAGSGWYGDKNSLFPAKWQAEKKLPF